MPSFFSKKPKPEPQPKTPSAPRKAPEGEVMIPTDKITPWRFANRPKSELGDMEALAMSIRSQGQMIAAVVRKSSQGYELIAGRRRYEACRQLGIELKCLVKNLSDQDAYALQAIENEQRENLSAYARALDYKLALDEGVFPSVQALAASIGQDRTTVSNILSFTRIPKEVCDAIGDMSSLGVQSAKTIVSLCNESETNKNIIIRRAKDVREGKLSIAGLGKLCRENKISLSERRVIKGKAGELFSVGKTPRGALTITILKDGKKLMDEDRLCRELQSLLDRVAIHG